MKTKQKLMVGALVAGLFAGAQAVRADEHANTAPAADAAPAATTEGVAKGEKSCGANGCGANHAAEGKAKGHAKKAAKKKGHAKKSS